MSVFHDGSCPPSVCASRTVLQYWVADHYGQTRLPSPLHAVTSTRQTTRNTVHTALTLRGTYCLLLWYLWWGHCCYWCKSACNRLISEERGCVLSRFHVYADVDAWQHWLNRCTTIIGVARGQVVKPQMAKTVKLPFKKRWKVGRCSLSFAGTTVVVSKPTSTTHN